MPTIEELRECLAIDKMALDDEVIKQPSFFYEVSSQLTEAIAERDAAKENLAFVDADLDEYFRKELARTHSKVTDTMVKSCVQTSQDHDTAFKAYLMVKTKAEKLLALKEAFQQRGYMLRDLVSLHSTNYYESSSLKPQYQAQRDVLAAARLKRGT